METQAITPSSVRTPSAITVMGTSDTTRTMRRAVTSRGETGTQRSPSPSEVKAVAVSIEGIEPAIRESSAGEKQAPMSQQPIAAVASRSVISKGTARVVMPACSMTGVEAASEVSTSQPSSRPPLERAP